MAITSSLLIDLGDLPSLVAIGLEADSSKLVLWHPRGVTATAERLAQVVAEHAEAFGVSDLQFGTAESVQPVDRLFSGLLEARLLVEAVIAARRKGCRRVIWPRQAGGDAESLGPVLERAELVTSLSELESGLAGPVVDLPVADLSDWQLADLAEDVGVPLHAFWPCERSGAEPCAACDGCRRWAEAFSAAKLSWPWATAAKAGMRGK